MSPPVWAIQVRKCAEVSSRSRTSARLVTAAAIITAYVALHLAITACLNLQSRDHFRDASARGAAFVTALDHYANGEVSARADILATAEWFVKNAPPRESRSTVTSAARYAEEGEVSAAREHAGNLVAQIGQDRARLDRDLSSSGTAALWWGAAAAVLTVPALWLRHRHRTGAAEIVGIVGRFAPRQPWWRRPVFLAASGAGYALFAAGLVAAGMAQRSNLDMPMATQVLLLPVGLAALGAGFLILRHSRPRSVRSAVHALRADARQPVLYLRSFADDSIAAQVDDGIYFNIHSREEQLAGLLGAFGPVIAVGKPGEPLPQLGAARFYLPLDDWQPTILQLMELSQLIVLSVGPGEGLWWEVEQALAIQPARKLVLLAPGRLSGVAERLDELLPAPSRLNELAADSSWISATIAFGPGWTPHVQPVVEPAPGARAPRGIKAGLMSLLVISPAHRVARAMKAALVAAGVRRRVVIMRADLGMLATFGKGLLVLTALAIPYRVLQLFGLW
ncbi:transferase [Streptomyces sp. NBC_01363]|uniref:transferase n=1 Tax=Streptomyces sp. NBC_01363 TaxID=2903840 RepID=UPI002250B134|nr:transferase [Streptomyces sp. NBC_01363]MCX4729467.1 transferase [Streptomyces sp. NBC_01363]MCX4736887.1 transferase [Streptomyces sp. NBC_01363]